MLPFHESQSPTSLSSKCSLMASPSMYLGQCFRFLIKAEAYTPCFFNSTIPFSTQKPLSSTTIFPFPKIGSKTRSNNPTVFPSLLNFETSWDGASFPSTSSICQRMPDNEQHTVWYSLPKGQGFLGTNIHPGQLYLLVQVLIDLSKQLTQLGVNCSVMLAFHASKISQTSQKRSLKAGGDLLVIVSAFRIISNRFLDI